MWPQAMLRDMFLAHGGVFFLFMFRSGDRSHRQRTEHNADGSVGDGGSSWRRRAEDLRRRREAGEEDSTKDLKIDDMRSYIDELKKKAYGKSWKKRGGDQVNHLLFHIGEE